jgi:hypothetical protein
MYQTQAHSHQAATTITRLPHPSAGHATCAWCGDGFPSIVALIDHVDITHVGDSRIPA